MATAKDIIIKPIPSIDANRLIKRLHYSGKVVQNSQLHLGVFLNGVLEGAMQFGPSLDKRKIQGLVEGTKWHEFMELNRLAFSDALPRNSESRALSIAVRLIKKYAPQIKWIISFADATQCGDGTIYRAAGFVLTGIAENKNLAIKQDGSAVHKMTFESSPVSTGYSKVTHGANDWGMFIKVMGWRRGVGFQLRYIYFIDPVYRARLTVPELPYSEIEKRGASMYKGKKRGSGEIDNAAQSNAQTGGASPTDPLLVQHV